MVKNYTLKILKDLKYLWIYYYERASKSIKESLPPNLYGSAILYPSIIKDLEITIH